MRLTLGNFFSHLIFHPFEADKNEKAIALVASIACGIFSVGICHVLCAIRNCLIHKPLNKITEQDRRVSGLKDSTLNNKPSDIGPSFEKFLAEASQELEVEKNKEVEISISVKQALIKPEGIPIQIVKNVLEQISGDQKASSWIIDNETFLAAKWSSLQLKQFKVWTLFIADKRLIQEKPMKPEDQNFKIFLMEENLRAGIHPSLMSKECTFNRVIISLTLNFMEKISA